MNKTKILIMLTLLLTGAHRASAQEIPSEWVGDFTVDFSVERSEGCSQTMVINGYTGSYALTVAADGACTLVLHIEHDHLTEPEDAPEEATEYEELWDYSWEGVATAGEEGLSLSLPQQVSECSRLRDGETRTVTCWDANPLDLLCQRQADNDARLVCQGGDLPLQFNDDTVEQPYLLLSSEPLHYERHFWNDPVFTTTP